MHKALLNLDQAKLGALKRSGSCPLICTRSLMIRPTSTLLLIRNAAGTSHGRVAMREWPFSTVNLARCVHGYPEGHRSEASRPLTYIEEYSCSRDFLITI